MWRWLSLGLCLVVSVSSQQLPDLTVHHQNEVLHFAMDHVPGLEEVYTHYQVGSKVKEVLPESKKMIKYGEKWLLKLEGLVLQPGDSVQYNAVAWGSQGRLTGPLNTWVYSPISTLHSRKIRAVIFRDDFNGASLDRAHWEIEVSMFGGYNWEFQVYSPEHYNVFTRNGHLFLKPTQTVDDPRWDENWLHNGVMDTHQIWGACTNDGQYGCHREGRNGMLPPVMSGKVKSKPTMRFGTLEVRARIPKGDWLWPAIWMLPRPEHYGGWPRSGEIDIMESRGNLHPAGHGVDEISSTLHWGSSPTDNHFRLTTGAKHGQDWSAAFHTWRLEWTHDHIATFVDNQQIFRVTPPAGGFSGLAHTGNIWTGGEKMAPFDQPFYLMFNVAVGGTSGFFPDDWNYGYPKPWSNTSPHSAQDFWQHRAQWHPSWHGDMAAMEIDWVEMRSL